MPPHLQVGEPAPEFTLANQQGKKIPPMTLEGKKLLLSFHPLAWTSVCEIQMRTLEAKFFRLEELDVIAYGLSVDSAPSKKAWGRVLDIEHTNLLADFWPHGQVAQQYGLFDADKGISARANILIGLDHRIEWMRVYEMAQIPDIEEIIDFIAANHQKSKE
ncbi:MAG: redoxin domain-containing protein [Desulfosudaceae bacterium]